MSEIKDGVYGFVSGTVGRVFSTKNGEAFELEVLPYKSQYPDKWTVWGNPGVSQGDRVKVAGWLEIKRDKYEKDGVEQVAIKRSVNTPKLEGHERVSHSDAFAPVAAPVAAEPAWDNSETPF